MTKQQLLAAADQEEKLNLLKQMILKGRKRRRKNQKYGIFGGAGVGKTYLAKQILEFINNEIFPDIKINVLACCLSHSANAVLENMLEGLDVDYNVMTLASARHHRPNIKEDGEMGFVYKPKKEKIGRKWVVIKRPLEVCNVFLYDECSQLDSKTILDIDSITHEKCIHIYLGDWCQTAPIDLKKCQYVSEIFNIPSVILTIPFRYEGNNYLFANELRKNINSALISLNALGKNNAFQKYLTENDVTKDGTYSLDCWKKFVNKKYDDLFFYDNKVKFWENVKSAFLENDDPYGCKIIAYNNYMQVNMGKRIRNYINKNDFDYQAEDMIMAMNNYYAYGGDGEIKLKNSEHAIIEKSMFITKKIAFIKNNSGDLHYFGYVNKDMAKEKMLLLYPDELSDVDEIEFKTVQFIAIALKGKIGFIPIAVAPHHKKMWTDVLKAINMGYYFDRDNWHHKYHPIHDFKSIIADIEYAFGSTCHKAQGMSIEKVFTHIPNIMSAKYSSDVAKLQCLYVAGTRAKIENHFYYGDN